MQNFYKLSSAAQTAAYQLSEFSNYVSEAAKMADSVRMVSNQIRNRFTKPQNGQHGLSLGERCQIMCARVSTIQSRQESGWSGQSKSQFHRSDFGALRIGNGKSRFPVIDRNAEFQCAKSHHRTPNKQHYKSLLKCCGFCGSVRLDMERKYLQRKNPKPCRWQVLKLFWMKSNHFYLQRRLKLSTPKSPKKNSG